MSHIELEELEASNMLDVLHFLFEEDLHAATGEEAEAKSNLRKTLYRTLYNREYKYGLREKSSSGSANTYADGSPVEFFDDLEPFDPLTESEKSSKPVKPYVPPTDFNPDSPVPFGLQIDSPLG